MKRTNGQTWTTMQLAAGLSAACSSDGGDASAQQPSTPDWQKQEIFCFNICLAGNSPGEVSL